MELSVRSYNALARYFTLKDEEPTAKNIAKLYENGKYTDIRNFGKKSQDEVRQALETIGLI